MIYILLPAYNEEKALAKLFDAIKETFLQVKEDYRVILVDDGSSDKTRDVSRAYAETMPLTLIEHEENKGLGNAMKTGFSHIRKVLCQEDFLVTLDADNTHNPGLIINMLKKGRMGYDMVIASRYAPGGKETGLSIYRKILSRGAGILLSVFFPVRGVRDYTCGYRLYSAKILNLAFHAYGENFIQEKGFACMAEILIKLIRFNPDITEEGLLLRYDLKEGPSKIKVMRTIFNYFYLFYNNRRLIITAFKNLFW